MYNFFKFFSEKRHHEIKTLTLLYDDVH